MSATSSRSGIGPSTGLDWANILFLGGYHAALLLALPAYLMVSAPSLGLMVVTLILIACCLLSITTGYHRLYAHKTYRTRRGVEWVLLFFGTLATQGSALKWSHDHRLHHKHVDSDLDPYGTPKGFWHSHVLWMFRKPVPWDARLVKDLESNRIVQLQHRYYGWVMAGANIAVVALVGMLVGDLFGAVVFAFLIRLFVVHHSTWFINSLAHMWGSKPYSSEHSAVNNFILAFLTYGEGYHNYHHTFASDYRNGIRWYQFDPPKYLIWLFSKIGLASDLKKVDRLTIKRNLLSADRRLMLEHLETIRHLDREGISEMIEHMFEPLSSKLVGLKLATERYQKIKQRGSDEMAALRRAGGEELAHVKERIAELRLSISSDMNEWRELCRFVLRLRAAVT